MIQARRVSFLHMGARYGGDKPGKQVSETSNTKFLRNRHFGKGTILMFFEVALEALDAKIEP